MPPSRSPAQARRRATAQLGLLVVVLVAAVVIALLAHGDGAGSGDGPRQLAPGAGTTDTTRDPFAYDADHRADFEARAAAGLAHVLYAKSPGGVMATARRVDRLRPMIEDVAQRAHQDPRTLEAIVFLESGGRSDVTASDDLNSAAGLTQILAQTATGLLGLKVDVARSEKLTGTIARSRSEKHIARLKAQRREVDERFDPRKALEATTRYLEFARDNLHGRSDLAVESYHMGIGNLQRALKAYGNEDIPYAQLFFDSTPLRHAKAWNILASLGDDSSTYLWRIGAAKDIMKLYRDDPKQLREQDALQDWPSAEHVLRPPQSTPVFDSSAALRTSDLAVVDGPALRVSKALAGGRVGERSLRAPALILLRRLALGVQAIAKTAPIVVTKAATTSGGQGFVGEGVEAEPSTHATGYAFDLSRAYRSPAQAQALQFWLDRLTALDLIAWVREPNVIHVTVGPRAGDS
ncbi:MAG TPA: transglycosylase SLT domain-containing protein [Baekduia sp.]|uniref:transglycosylase SLT domain-containing protein n=1 Tax=Baekduia sp. TaxID=2600305 RepID=UPI002D78B295|nr:transglycosylase SLT domain-containing protein [Baekduia sp.]HET6508942.1 transglycosylase SLT domain-containing protein [Baekduia sp.]